VGSVYRKQTTRLVPPGAEIITRKGQRFARWINTKGRKRTAPLTVGQDGTERIITEAATYTGKYRNASGVVVERSTGCRDEQNARQTLAGWEREAERVRAGVMTPAEQRTAQHQSTLLAAHLDAYTAFLKAKNCHPNRVSGDRRRVERVAAALGWQRLADLDGEALTRWLGEMRGAGSMTPANSNAYRQSLVGFANWCRKTARLFGNPLEHVPAVAADPERKPRALSPDELRRLLFVARLRPLAEYGRPTMPRDSADRPADGRGRRTWTKAPLDLDTIAAAAERGRAALARRPDAIEHLEHIGWGRSLTYKALLLTGLRKNELASLTVGQLNLDGPVCYASLDATDEKSGEGNDVPLRDDLVADLRDWLADKLARMQSDARNRGEPIPARLLPGTPVFDVPAGLLRILNRDVKAAGIPKKDERGRAVCLHGLRHTFGTLLSTGGVAPRTAQDAMRHSDIRLTMNVYTDPRLLDTAGALNALPAMPLDEPGRQAERATGTAGARMVAPTVAPVTGKPRTTVAIPDKAIQNDAGRTLAATGEAVKNNERLSTAVLVEPRGIEPLTSALRTLRSPS
jgi:integrase